MYFCTMKKILVFILLIASVLSFSACHKKRIQEKPDGLISQHVIINVIADCYLVESMVYLLPDDVDKATTVTNLYVDLFKKYEITKEQFVVSMEYYLGDEETATQILTAASKTLAERRKIVLPDEDTHSEEPTPTIAEL